jgi:hypothetical protein
MAGRFDAGSWLVRRQACVALVRCSECLPPSSRSSPSCFAARPPFALAVAEYGELLALSYPSPNGTQYIYEDFRQILPFNPCPTF